MTDKSKTSKTGGTRKSPVKVTDMKPASDAKGGGHRRATTARNFGSGGGLNQNVASKPGHGYDVP